VFRALYIDFCVSRDLGERVNKTMMKHCPLVPRPLSNVYLPRKEESLVRFA
jgi:hypothetical protein